MIIFPFAVKGISSNIAKILKKATGVVVVHITMHWQGLSTHKVMSFNIKLYCQKNFLVEI